METPLIDYMRTVLDEHTIPLADEGAGLIEATWLVDMIHKVEEHYKKNGSP
jgi:hypothetical protein